MAFEELTREQMNLAWGGMIIPARLPKQTDPNIHKAFYPTDHYNLTREAARHAGFDDKTSNWFSAATHNVDYNNFATAHAHANTDVGETMQHSIDANIDLAHHNGDALHHAIGEFALHHTDHNASAIVDAVGVATHQLQDSYAHQGMSFAQHHALDASGHSPDADAVARGHAAEMTNHLMFEVAAELRHAGIEPSSFHPPAVHNQLIPNADQLGAMYDYKYNSPAWNGVDTRWPAAVNDRMYTGFVTGLHGGS